MWSSFFWSFNCVKIVTMNLKRVSKTVRNIFKKNKSIFWVSIPLFFILVVFLFSNLSVGLLLDWSFYQSLANPSIKTVNIREGLRKEEVAEVLTMSLGWSQEQKQQFLTAHLAYDDNSYEGKYFPKTYLIHKDAPPTDVSKTLTNEYDKKISKIKRGKTTQILNEDTALIIASLIQREAAGKGDMRLISGIIWNRVFAGMKLQIDATLQYAKGEEELWWPRVDPRDKYIESPFNTYKYNIPPSPIASPGIAAIEAAYNPQKTSCMFYLHDKYRRIHCSRTYEEHKAKIKRHL